MAIQDITAAVVGAGFIGPLHVEALRRIGVRVAGVAAATADEAARAAAQLGVPRAYASVEELCADPAVQAVHITSPNRLHVAHVLAVLEAGKHVVCEKPLAMTASEARTLVDAAQARPHLVAAVNYNLRFYPQVLQARALCRADAIGRPFHLHGCYVQDWLLEPTDFNWRVLRGEGGALRAVGDIGTHWMDMVSFITGDRITAVSADLATVHPTRLAPMADAHQTFGSGGAAGRREVAVDTEDYAGILLRFASGLRGTLTVSQVNAGRKNSLRWELAGSAKAMAWDSEEPNQLWIGERHQFNQLAVKDPSLLMPEAARFASYPGGHTEGFADTFKQAFRAIYADIEAGAPSASPLYATFADGLEEMRVCDAIARSAVEERWVSIDSHA